MKPKNFLFDIHKFILSLWVETKHVESFCFLSWKETLTRDNPTESIYSIVQDEHHENGFTITPGNSLGMMNLLIQRI